MAPALPTINRAHIRPGDRLCAAVSGGADSVAMLLLLHAANQLPRNALGVGLSAVHIHHGLRGEEADADLVFVQSLCGRLDVPLRIHHADTPARIAATGETTEEAARNLRYIAFRELLRAGQADSILTAHTLDDQAETVLMKFLRGAWTEGLSGIHPVVSAQDLPAGSSQHRAQSSQPDPKLPRPGKILRPLLAVRRAELRAFLESRTQPWREDSTNTDAYFTRNRVRAHLLPILREYNPSLDQTLAHLAELAREDEARWQSELARTLPQLLLPGKPVRGGGRAVSTTAGEASLAVDLDRLRALDPALRRRVVRAAARQLGVRLSFDETARLLALAGLASNPGDPAPGTPPPPSSRLHLAEGLRAERSARELRLSKPAPEKPSTKDDPEAATID